MRQGRLRWKNLRNNNSNNKAKREMKRSAKVRQVALAGTNEDGWAASGGTLIVIMVALNP